MSKINLLFILLMTSLLSACGFHTPQHNTSLNAVVMANDNNTTALELVKRFDLNARQKFIVQVGDEVQKQQTSSYTSANKVKSYTLSLTVPVKIYNANQQLQLSKDLTAKTHLSKMDNTQADRLQINEGYEQLRNTIIKKLIRRLNRLNEN